MVQWRLVSDSVERCVRPSSSSEDGRIEDAGSSANPSEVESILSRHRGLSRGAKGDRKRLTDS